MDIRRIAWLAVVMAAGAAAQPAQVFEYVLVDPSGACSNNPNQQNTVTGGQFACVGGTWTAVTSGSGSFTALSGDATSTATGGATTVSKFNGGTAFGTAAGVNTGTSGHVLGFLDGASLAWSGGPWTFQPASDSGTAFQILNHAGSVILDIDSTNGRVGIGTSTVYDTLYVSGKAGITQGLVLGTGYLSPVSLLQLAAAPTATANYGTFSIGGGSFAGGGAPTFTGSASGTSIAVNEVAGYTGDLLNLQVAGVPKFVVGPTGTLTATTITSAGVIAGFNSGTCSGYLKSDGTCSTPGASGTVTVVGSGSLTSTALVTGGGTTTLQTPSATATMDASGNISTPGGITVGAGGSTAGYQQFGQGTAPSAGTTAVTLYAPAAVTSYLMKLPAAAASGLMRGDNSTGIVTLAQSELSGDCVTSGSNSTVCRPSVLTSTSGAVADPGGSSAYQFNNGTGALTFNAPDGVAGIQRCYRNATTRTGVITVQMAASNTVDINGANGSSAGTLVSGGALGDAVCIVSDAAHHWYGFVEKGTWANN